MYTDPLAFFITIRTYGTWLHGDRRGSVDLRHNRRGTPLLPPNRLRESAAREKMIGAAFVLQDEMRTCIDRAVRELAEFRSWKCWALNVRTNHLHVVVTAGVKPERVMSDVKARSTRRLREAKLIEVDRILWTRHGSTEYLWNDRDLEACCRYVNDFQ